MTQFTPLPSLLGGILIGLASALLLLGDGRLAGISGIVAGVLRPERGEWTWRVLFVAGLLVGGVLVGIAAPQLLGAPLPRSGVALAVAGLLVGFGTRLGGGCTSGHGVCGLAQFSPRSLVGVLVFIGTGAITVAVVNRVFGGAL